MPMILVFYSHLHTSELTLLPGLTGTIPESYGELVNLGYMYVFRLKQSY